MSDNPQAPDWWKASDGKWYPPPQQGAAPPPPTQGSYPSQGAFAQQGPAKKKGGCLKTGLIIGAVLLALIIGVSVLAAGGGDDGDDTASDTNEQDSNEGDAATNSDVDTNSGNDENPPPEDVVVTGCAPDPTVNFMSVQGTVTNNSSEASSYTIQVAYETPDGSTQLTTGAGFISRLEPGQNAPLEAPSLEEAPPGGYTCRVTSVERFAAT